MSELFGIEHGYHGQVLSNLARLHMTDAVEASNEKHLAPWSDACLADNITNTPLSPFIDKVGLAALVCSTVTLTLSLAQELLYNRHLHVNGSKIEGTGFDYEVPQITVELLREVSGHMSVLN